MSLQEPTFWARSLGCWQLFAPRCPEDSGARRVSTAFNTTVSLLWVVAERVWPNKLTPSIESRAFVSMSVWVDVLVYVLVDILPYVPYINMLSAPSRILSRKAALRWSPPTFISLSEASSASAAALVAAVDQLQLPQQSGTHNPPALQCARRGRLFFWCVSVAEIVHQQDCTTSLADQ